MHCGCPETYPGERERDSGDIPELSRHIPGDSPIREKIPPVSEGDEGFNVSQKTEKIIPPANTVMR